MWEFIHQQKISRRTYKTAFMPTGLDVIVAFP